MVVSHTVVVFGRLGVRRTGHRDVISCRTLGSGMGSAGSVYNISIGRPGRQGMPLIRPFVSHLRVYPPPFLPTILFSQI